MPHIEVRRRQLLAIDLVVCCSKFATIVAFLCTVAVELPPKLSTPPRSLVLRLSPSTSKFDLFALPLNLIYLFLNSSRASRHDARIRCTCFGKRKDCRRLNPSKIGPLGVVCSHSLAVKGGWTASNQGSVQFLGAFDVWNISKVLAPGAHSESPTVHRLCIQGKAPNV